MLMSGRLTRLFSASLAFVVGFLALCLLFFSPNAQARPTEPQATPEPPVLGEHCVDVGPLPPPPEDWCGCVWGAVYANGIPTAGVTITLTHAGLETTFVTTDAYGWQEPYYALDGRAAGAVYGDWMTITAAYEGQVVSRTYRAFPNPVTKEQRVNLAFPDGTGSPPTASIDEVSVVDDSLLLRGSGIDNDEGGAAVVGFEWLSDLDGVIGTEITATLLLTDLTEGIHTLGLKVLDDEGMWSSPVTETLDWINIHTVSITGPEIGILGTTHWFTAEVSPATALKPITYTWQATSQSPVTNTSHLHTDMLSFTWITTGMRRITVTATNAYNLVSATRSISIVPLFEDVGLTGLPDAKNSSAIWGDYDNDGDLDILLTGGVNDPYRYVANVYRNDGGVFTDVQADLMGVDLGSAAWGDYDGDGNLDVVLIGRTESNDSFSQVYRNEGNDTFVGIDASLLNVSRGSVTWGDYDNDGDLDIALMGEEKDLSANTKLYRNNGDQTFSDVNAPLGKASNGSIAWGDYDNDGDLDILLTGHDGIVQVSAVYRNDGNGQFVDIAADLTGAPYSSVAWGDYDNDGDLDILLTGNYIALVYRNDGGDTFTDINAGLTGVHHSSAAWGDYDNDGDLDILLMGGTTSTQPYNPITKVYCNEGGDTFIDINAGLPGVLNGSVAWGDYDDDGDLDILLTGRDGADNAVTKIYRNNSIATNTPPGAPSDLNSIVTGTVTLLSWSESSDAQTPTDGLTYNLRVGSEPGASDIMAPMALTAGYRQIPALGNAQHQLTATLILPLGTYYWSVQAVDSAWSGSEFADEGSFTIDTIPVSPRNVIINGPTTGQINKDDTFVAIVNPVTSTIPITYRWQATGQNDIVLMTHDLRDTVIFSWTTPGPKTITITVDNGGGIVSTVHRLDITTDPLFENIDIANLQNVGNSSVAWGDYDNDGDLDILLTGNEDNTHYTKVYRNEGNGVFVDIDANLTGVSNSSVAWGDYDNDSDLDVLLTGWDGSENVAKVYRNDDDGIFTDTNASLTGVQSSSVAWGDYDNDGDLDILLTGWVSATSYTALVYRNDQGEDFVNINANLKDICYGSVAWGDYDNDADLDILLTGFDGNDYVTEIYRNDNGSFIVANTTLPGVRDSSVAWGDYDNDGDLDILLTGYSTNAPESISKIFRNIGQDTFVEIDANLFGICNGSAAWGDYDNDGDLDILLTGINAGVFATKVYRNDQDGEFVDASGELLTALYRSSAAWGDYDNDGDLDILLTGLYPDNGTHYVTQVYRNNITVVNTLPGAPQGLNATTSITMTDLSWTAPNDLQTPSAGLVYNLQVGSEPGLSDILAPMSLDSGYRLIPALGNAQHGLTATLVLTPGTYYWSVQAIDTAWAGSPFATESVFTISPPVSPTHVTVTGLTTGTVGTAYALTATVNPTATTPITYIWQATDQSPVTHIAGRQNIISFTWGLTGPKTITVTAANDLGYVTATHYVTVAANPPSIWLVMLYLDGEDFRLEWWLDHALHQIQASSVPDGVTVVVLFDGDGHPANNDTRLYEIRDHQLIELAPGWLNSEMNVGDPNTLIDFVAWALETYPAEYTYLSLADHGAGVRGTIWDETSIDYLEPTDLIALTQNLTPSLDVVHLDSCLMGMSELAYQFRNSADYLVASENLAFGIFAYADYIAALPNLAPAEFAVHIADTYYDVLPGYPRTISALDLGQMDALVNALRTLTATLTISGCRSELDSVLGAVQHFDSGPPYYVIDETDEYIDLYHFAQLVMQFVDDPAVDVAAQAVMDILEAGQPGSVILQEHHQSGTYGTYWDLDNAHGLSIYYPSELLSPYYAAYFSYPYPFLQDSTWRSFLKKCVGDPGPPLPNPDPNPAPILLPHRIFLPVIIKR